MNAPIFATSPACNGKAGIMLLPVLVACMLTGNGSVFAQVPNSSDANSVRQTLTIEVPEDERVLHKLVEDAVSGSPGAGAWTVLADHKPVYLSRDVAVLQALHRNLALRVKKADPEIVREAIQEAEAVFDPLLTVGIGQRKQKTHERLITGTVVQRKFVPSSPQSGLVIIDSDAPQVSSIGFRRRLQDETVTKEIVVSEKQINGPEEATEYNVSLGQLLPWGTRITLSMETIDKQVYYNNRGDSYGASWSTNALLDLQTPVPGAAGFGNNGPHAIQRRIQRADYKLANWEIKAAIDALSAEVDAAYWALVGLMEHLAQAGKNVRLVEEQVARSKRQLQLGKTTAYALALFEAELARARAQEEGVRQEYVTASGTMGSLITGDKPTSDPAVYIPYGYKRLLTSAKVPDRDTAIATAMRERPDVHIQKLTLGKQRLLLQAAHNQARPNVNFSAAVNLMQDGSVYGYKSATDSVRRIFDADSRSQNYGLRYRYPLFNNAAAARVKRATDEAEEVRLFDRGLEQSIHREIATSYGLLHVTSSQMEYAREAEALSQAAYDRLQNRRTIGADVDTNEMLQTLRNLDQAGLALSSARIAHKQAETALYYAMGMLQQMRVSDVLHNPFERSRVAVLLDAGVLKYFTPPQTLDFGGKP